MKFISNNLIIMTFLDLAVVRSGSLLGPDCGSRVCHLSSPGLCLLFCKVSPVPKIYKGHHEFEVLIVHKSALSSDNSTINVAMLRIRLEEQ